MSGRRRWTGAAPRPTEQEQDVLRFLLEQRYATSRQLARAARARYGSDRSAARQTNRLLQKLGSIGLLHVLPRTVGGQARGSSAGIWTITNRGARLVGGGDAESQQRKKRYRRDQDPSLTFLEHTLAISELRVQLAELQNNHHLKIESITPEPTCWRPYLGTAGQRIFLKPDLAVVTSTPDGYEDHWFLEVDLATENPARIVTKCRQYQHYRRSGLEQRRTGVFPAVVWITPTTRRRDQLASRIASEADLDDQLFGVVSLDDFAELIITGHTEYRIDHQPDGQKGGQPSHDQQP
ncbi:replication-relaxation family protein [Rathayibacter sp. Leaf248]|uniref:replication-relaxation family protein n=1 Tax=Rathayibacter sp. Leaf248 TaxID=2876555 RepID=UPI001E5B557F|nr:replication-relaxation family protein [Rathayibacter sp. Leaf248]